MRLRQILMVLTCLAHCASFQVAAQSFPSRPVRIIVPYAPGGTADVLCRDIASKLTPALGQQVIVENRAGAAGMIGADALAKSAPDGYTLGMLATPHAATPFVMKLPFDPAKDLSPVTLVANVPGLLSVNASVPVKSLQELLSLARAKPGQLTYGHPGNLSAGHLAMELLKEQTNVSIVPVPYKGGGPALMDLLGGQITMMISGPTAHLPHIATGKLRPIATTALRRSTALPDVPTIGESGLPGFELNEWYGLFVPARTPSAEVVRLNEEIVKVIKSREYTARAASLGAEAVGNKPEEFGVFFRNEMEKHGKLIRSLGLKAE